MARQDEVLTLVLFYVAVGPDRQPRRPAPPARRGAARQLRPNQHALRLQPQGRRAPPPSTTWSGPPSPTSSATLKCDSLLLAPDEGGRLAIAGAFPPEDRLDVRDRSAARLGLGARRAGRPRLRHAALLALAVPAGRHPAGPARRARHRLGRRPHARPGAAPAARPAGRPGGHRARAHPPRRRPRADPGPLRDRTAARGAALLGQPRPAHAAGRHHRRRQRHPRGRREAHPRRSAASSPRRSRRRASG